jgi:hypothetical protein
MNNLIANMSQLAMVNINHSLSKEFKNENYHSSRSVPGGGMYSVIDSIRLVLQV